MRLDYLADGTIRVTLSERNVKALLHKLELDGSMREIFGGFVYADSALIDDHVLALRAHDDAQPARIGVEGDVVVSTADRHPFLGRAAVLYVDLGERALKALLGAASHADRAARGVQRGRFQLIVESDDAHYARREPAGEMLPETEEAILLLDGPMTAADDRGLLDLQIVLLWERPPAT